MKHSNILKLNIIEPSDLISLIPLNENFNKLENEIQNTQISNALPSGTIIAWNGNISNIPEGWVLCNGTNGTPNLRGKMIVGADTDPVYITYKLFKIQNGYSNQKITLTGCKYSSMYMIFDAISMDQTTTSCKNIFRKYTESGTTKTEYASKLADDKTFSLGSIGASDTITITLPYINSKCGIRIFTTHITKENISKYFDSVSFSSRILDEQEDHSILDNGTTNYVGKHLKYNIESSSVNIENSNAYFLPYIMKL